MTIDRCWGIFDFKNNTRISHCIPWQTKRQHLYYNENKLRYYDKAQLDSVDTSIMKKKSNGSNSRNSLYFSVYIFSWYNLKTMHGGHDKIVIISVKQLQEGMKWRCHFSSNYVPSNNNISILFWYNLFEFQKFYSKQWYAKQVFLQFCLYLWIFSFSYALSLVAIHSL